MAAELRSYAGLQTESPHFWQFPYMQLAYHLVE